MKYDLIVIGAGPAGMNAAIMAASYGANVAIIDENPEAGGKLLGQLHQESKGEWWNGRAVAGTLVEKVNQLEIDMFQGKEVWGIYPRWKVMVNSGEELQAELILIAAGAAEKAIPAPGWTLPGVMGIGAAQTLTNYHHVKPGQSVAIIGVDPLSLSVAQQLKMAGVNVVGIFLPPQSLFSKDKSNPTKMLTYLSSMSHAAPNKLLQAAGKVAQYSFIKKFGASIFPRFGIGIWGTRLFLRKAVLEISGYEQVESIKIAPIDKDGTPNQNRVKIIDVDCVCISGGLYPLIELAGAVGCESVYVEELGGHIPLHNPEMETTQPGIFVAGNITGIESAKVAMAQGELVGISVSSRLGLIEGDSAIHEAQKKVKETRKNAAITFQQHIDEGRKKSLRLWQKNRHHAKE
ncbi:NAD(P)/FAD-dependent oxidoreductase [Virgibacillus doumboii]|uniref:NAD(P)/FAD-dependent oxidoreductase n=1 Tax=Virgibacillus doumboii TaxID=2697503 RepID=UPI0013DFB96D|nr:NAD(P)/FAD-dependent oxidoreductase [Virgibacillus doumboii]